MHVRHSKIIPIFFSVLFFGLVSASINISTYAGNKSITLNYKEEDITYSTQQGYDIVELSDFYFITDSLKIGEPMMPMKIIRVLLPSGTEVKDINIISTTAKKLTGEYNIYPVQHPQITGKQKKKEFVKPKKEVYESDNKYPQKLVDYNYDGYFRDYHIVEILVYPIQYTPAQKELTFYSEINFEIEYSTSSEYQPLTKLRSNEEKENKIKEKLKMMIINPEDIPSSSGLSKSKSKKTETQELSITTSPSALEGQDVEYIIITSEDLVSDFQRLADWKTKKGIVTAIKTTSWISENYAGCDLQEKIRHFIQDAYQKWNTDYVLLGGDTDIIPTRIDDSQSYDPSTDLYYSGIVPLSNNWNSNGDSKFGDGADYIADIWVGRAPVHNSSEVDIFIDKVFTYERNSLAPSLPSSAYLTKMVSMAGIVSFYGYSWTCGIYAKEQVHNNLLPSSFTNWRMYEYDSTYGGNYSYDEMLSRTNAINAMNEGYGIINHIDHSNQYSMEMGSQTNGGAVNRSDADNLTNGNKYFVLFTAGCAPGAIDYDCIGEHFVLAENKGAVAFVGPSRSIYTVSGNHYDYEFFESLFTNNIFHIGQTLGLTWYNDHAASRYNLLGDPELPIWTETPQSLVVSHPAAITNGETDITVTISNLPSGQEALICLQKENEDYAVQTVTGTGSSIEAGFTITPDTPGELSVTVTSHNFIPYESTITVSQTGAYHVYVQSYEIDDDESGASNGNSNGNIDAGETIELPITLKCAGSTSVYNLVGTLAAYEKNSTSQNPYVTITDGTKNFGDISSGASQTSPADFVFTISTDCPQDETIKFVLTMIDDISYTGADTFYVQLGAAEIQHTAHTINGTLDAGETVELALELSNYSTTTAKQVTAVLSSSSSYIASINSNSASFGDIEANSSAEESFEFTIDQSYSAGNEDDLSFLLTIEDDYGRLWSHSFDLEGPNTPTGLTFTGHETAIDVKWSTNNDSDLKGYNVYRSSSQAGTYEKVNTRLIEGTSYFNDSGLQKETTYYYKVTAVDSSSNESTLSDYIEGWTTIAYLSGWPIEGENASGIISSTSLFDIDNDGDMEIFSADVSGRVYAWDHTGDELFDIDSNPTTTSGFAYVSGADFFSTPAIGDLDGDGIYELVIVGRNNNETLYCWHIDDADNDNQPDPYWEVDLGNPCLSSPVIGDIDGDTYQEIVVMSHNGEVHIRNYDGTVFSDPWKTIGNTSLESYCTPALADLDDDGDLEIIIGGNDGYLYVCHHDGTDYSENWPFNTQRTNLSSSPAIADIDGDGEYEIIFVAGDSNTVSSCMIYVKDEYGDDKSGWTSGKSIATMRNVVASSPAIGNLDSDDQLEIVVKTGTQIYAFDTDGTNLTGWPIVSSNTSWSSPVIANIDENDGQEVIIGSSDHNLYAWHADGTAVEGWPLITSDIVYSTPAVSDVNGDGDYEIVAGSYDNSVYIWNTNGTGKKDWPMFNHNAQNTACFGNTSWSGNISITEQTTIPAGTVLSIQPGTTISISSGVSLIINGKLNAIGTSSQPITFTSQSGTSPSSWGYLELNGSGASGSQMKYVNINYGSGVRVISVSDFKISNCAFTKNYLSLYALYSDGSISNNNFTSNSSQHSIHITYSSPVNCNGNVITKTGNGQQSGHGIQYNHGSTGRVYQNDVSYCDRGIDAIWGSDINSRRNSYSTTGKNNRVRNCKTGLMSYRESYMLFGVPSTSTLYWGNSIYDNNTNAAVATSYATYNSQLLAYYTWWGSATPDVSKFSTGTNAAFYYSPCLTSDPWENASESVVSTKNNFEEYSSTTSVSESQQKLVEVIELQSGKKYQEAAASLIPYITKNPEDQEAYVQLYGCYSAETADEIIKFFTSLPTEASKNHKLLLSNLYLRQGDIEAAKEVNNSIITENPNTILAAGANINNLYIALYNETNYGRAIESYKNLLSISEFAESSELTEIEEEIEVYAQLHSKSIPDFELLKEEAAALEAIPDEYSLLGNYPNPFNPSTNIQYGLAYKSSVKLIIFDILGREVKTFNIPEQSAGLHEITWNGDNNSGAPVASGIYIYYIKAASLEGNGESFEQTSKVMLLK